VAHGGILGNLMMESKDDRYILESEKVNNMSRIIRIVLLLLCLSTVPVFAADIYLVDQDRNGKIDIKDALAYMQSVAELRQTNTTLAHAIAVLQINASITVEAQEILKQQIETNGSQGNRLSGQIPLDLGVNSSDYNIEYTDLGDVNKDSLGFENEALLFQTVIDTEPGIYTVVAKFTPKDDPSKPVYEITFNYEVLVLDSDGDGDPDSTDPEPNEKKVYTGCLDNPENQVITELGASGGSGAAYVEFVNDGISEDEISGNIDATSDNVDITGDIQIYDLGNGRFGIAAPIAVKDGVAEGDPYSVEFVIRHNANNAVLTDGSSGWKLEGTYTN
jgi:hypothetical protein